MEHNEAIECMRQHIREFVELEVNARVDEYLHKMDRNGQLSFKDWDGVHLSLPRAVTTAILEEAAERVIWSSERPKHLRQVNALRRFL